MSTPLPPSLEFGEHCHIFASLYEGHELSIPDTSAVLTARHVDMTDLIDFSAQQLQQPQQQQQSQQQGKQQNGKGSSSNWDVGGRSVGFDRVASGPTRSTDLVESLLPYALSVGSSTMHSSIVFVNNLGSAESPFQAMARGDTSTLYQILASMYPWVRRRSMELDAALIAWDSWGDAFDLLANQVASASSPLSPAEQHTATSLDPGASTTIPITFTGTGRMFDQLNTNRIVQDHSRSGTSSGGNRSRYKTVPELCEVVERKVSALRKQIAASSFSKDTASSEHRYAVCLRLDLVPTGVDAEDELSWGSLSVIEVSGAMLCQARTSRRGTAPSLLACVRSLFLPSDESATGVSSLPTETQQPQQQPQSAPLQSLSELPQRPELSLATCVVGPTCNTRIALVLPVPEICYGSSALFVQACVDAACLVRKEWITSPDPPPPRTCDTALKLFSYAYQCRAKEANSLRWLLRRHRNCKLQNLVGGTASLYPNAVPVRDDNNGGAGDLYETNNSFRLPNDSFRMDPINQSKTSVNSLAAAAKKAENDDASSASFSIPAIDAWIIAMRRRLESLEEVEAEQQEWHAWLEDYREWLLSVPAAGQATQTILVPAENATATATAGESSGAGNTTAATTTTTTNMVRMTVSWAERCELLERIVAQQQDELKRVKRICARDIENLREEVSLLRACQSHAPAAATTSLSNYRPTAVLLTASGADGNEATNNSNASSNPNASFRFGNNNNNSNNTATAKNPLVDNTVAYFNELRNVLQGFEFDVVALRNNAALTPEDAAFEIRSMVDRLAHDAQAIVSPLIEESNKRGIKQRAAQLVPSEWKMPTPPPDPQVLFRHERLRLRALAGALARGCDDLASRIGAAVSALEESAALHNNSSNKTSGGGAMMSEFSNVNDAASFLALSNKASNKANASEQQHQHHRKAMLDVDPNSRAAATAAAYSQFVLSTVHQQWCRNVALSLRNSAEGVAQDLDGQIQEAGNVHTQDAAIAELCGRFFANRATRVVAGRASKDKRAEGEDETTALSRVLAQKHREQQQAAAAAGGKKGGGADDHLHQQSSHQRVTSVNLHSLTGREGLSGASLRSSKFRKGLFSNEQAASRVLTPRSAARR